MLKKSILWIFVIFISVQIFSFSSATAAQSSNTSKKVTEVVVEVVKKTRSVPKAEEATLFEVCHKIVRKTAHFSEFMLLAIFVAALCRSYRFNMHVTLIISLLYPLLFAAADEFHQLFVDGRSGQITDVLIDFSGALTGTLAFVLCRFILLHIRRKKSS